MKPSSIILIFLSVPFLIFAQNRCTHQETILNGFANKIEGTDYNHHSSVPLANECIIARANDGKSYMEWETALAPETTNAETVTYAWLAGIGSSPGIDWVYNISSSADVSQTAATRFGRNNRVPFLARVLPGGGSGEAQNWEESIIDGWPENVILVSSTLDKEGSSCILHVRETEGKSADMKSLTLANNKQISPVEVNVLSEIIARGSAELKPFETKFFKVSW